LKGAIVSIIRRLLQVLGWITVALVGYVFLVLTVVRLMRRYWHFPPPPFIMAFLDSPMRESLQPPAQVIGWMDVRWGMQVLEFGPGAGTFTVEAARRVGPMGKVHAVDVQPEKITKLEARLRRRRIKNVAARAGSAQDLPFPDRSLDRVFMVTVLADIPDRQSALREFRRVLKADGLLAVAEFFVDPDYPVPATVDRWCRQAGFVPAGAYYSTLHYVLLFKPGVEAGDPKAKEQPVAVVEGAPEEAASEFVNDEAGYLAWLADYPDGFVLDAMRNENPEVMVLHRARCVSVNDYAPGEQWGSFTENRHMKVCGQSVGSLREWVRHHGREDGSFSGTCAKCAPPA
jgi:ubiquinone/menaquinone biosynthesis C-methylase UbiE